MNPADKIEKHFRLAETQKRGLKKLGIQSVGELLYHFPSRYADASQFKNIASLIAGENAVVFGKISKLKTSKGFRTKIAMAEAIVEDESGKIKIVWFNQPYLAKMLREQSLVRVEGRISQKRKDQSLYLSNPKIESVSKLPTGAGDSLFGDNSTHHILYPVYPESRGITSNWLYHSIQKTIKSGILENIEDFIPREILEKYHLPTLKSAIIWIHAPRESKDAEAAKKRFAFEEVFLIQLEKQIARQNNRLMKSFKIEREEKDVDNFLSRMPFKATDAQLRAIKVILSDFRRDYPMSRLLEGDVGSGKTLVAAATMYTVIASQPINQTFGNLQGAYMAPTEILAEQHFQSFINYFSHMPINIGLITSSGCKKFPSKLNPSKATDISRAQLLKWVANGEIPILIGTHSLIQKKVQFKHLAYVIIDEQHRFGVNQRMALVRRTNAELTQNPPLSASVPHLLSMSATPIPRTLALTIFGDLDLTLLDEMPPGRKPIITELVLPGERENCYKKVQRELESGRQAYIICPRIDEPDPDKELALNVKSVKEEAKRLKRDVFPDYEIAILHSKMKDGEKEKTMLDFKAGQIDIMVATSVIEVGVNVPNATTIIIEGAERFGLSQLHQLRGRVIRSEHQAYCYIFAESKSEKTNERLMAIKNAKNGFELAEYDLKLRGAGELYGSKQWGLTDIAMEGIKNIKMVEAARLEARQMVETDPTLENYPKILDEISSKEKIHLE